MHLTRSTITTLINAMLLIGCSDNSKDRIEASGTIEGTDVNIGSEVSGRVKEVRIEEGTKVNAGDTLVLIDDTDYQIQLRVALANQEAAEAQYRVAAEGSRKEDILQAEAALKSADKDFKRMKELLDSQTITQKQYDDAEARFVSAQQTYDKLVHGLRVEEIIAVRARRDQAAAQADQLKKKVRDCHVLAPSAGVITLKGVEPGELVGPGSNLVRITYLGKVKLTIYVNEEQISGILLGQKATVTTDAGGVFEGRVIYKSPVAEFTPKNVQTKEERTKLVFGVKILIDNPEDKLTPGIPADASISLTQPGSK
jgi:HlyD family secretion protein